MLHVNLLETFYFYFIDSKSLLKRFTKRTKAFDDDASAQLLNTRVNKKTCDVASQQRKDEGLLVSG